MSYKIKVTSETIKKLKSYWERAKKINEEYWKKIAELETEMNIKLKRDYEIFHSDGDLAGIGTYERTMRLIHRHELEK